MDRREWLQRTGALGASLYLSGSPLLKWMEAPRVRRADFGHDFVWGAATAAYQIEGAHDLDGKGPSIWDEFSHRKGKIKDGSTGDVACDFYHRYESDLDLMKAMGIGEFRFSLSWSRLFPQGRGARNEKGFDFYHRLIDACLSRGIRPWVTLYHWDLPQALEAQGGWTSRSTVNAFTEYTAAAARAFGDRVHHWMVLNEPMAFTGLGYMLGMHAPGRKGIGNFLAAVYHAALAQGCGGQELRAQLPRATIGTTFSASWVEPWRDKEADVRAAARFDALWNRLFLEPALLGSFPQDTLPFLSRLEKHHQAGDEQLMKFHFDFIGLQNYTREVIRRWFFPPVLWARIIPPAKRDGAQLTDMGWEVYPEGIYHLLKKFSAYPGAPPVIVTENGAAFPDVRSGDRIADPARIDFLQSYLAQVLRASREGVPVKGYFIWTLLDNFEWAEGFRPRFGLVHVDFASQQRRIKDSGLWYRDFLSGTD